MRKMLIAWLAMFCLPSCDFGGSPDYQYQTITSDSSYSNWKATREQAIAAADSEFAAFARGECRRLIANGWELHRVKSEGEMNCEQSAQGLHCRKKQVEIECRTIDEFFP